MTTDEPADPRDPDATTKDGARDTEHLSLEQAEKLVDNGYGGVGNAAAVILAELRRVRQELADLLATP
jgi:hypothetical protein